jgi:RNA polymerase sigma-70 factor, ECF subfamily
MQSMDELGIAFDAGRATWPAIRLDRATFERHLQESGVLSRDLATHPGDLYLACACARGDTAALRVLEDQYIRTMDVHLSRAGVPPDWLSEVHQKVRLKLLVGSRPGIANYRGQGPLGAFVRVTAVRVAVDVAATAAAMKKRPDEEIVNLLVSMDASPEVATAKALYRERFRAAIEETLAGLSKREKTLLRLHFIDGLNIDGIGSVYRVHRATVARWLVGIRGRVLADLRQRLQLHLGGTPSELRSLVTLLREDIDLSAQRILATRSGDLDGR